MDLGAMKILLDQALASPPNGRVIDLGAGVEANISRPLEEMKIAERGVPAGDASDVFEISANRPGSDRQRERIDDALLVPYVVVELDVDDGQSREAERANAEIRRARWLEGRVQGDGLLDGTRNQLLDLLGCGSRPLALGGSHADRDIRVLALGHVLIAKPAPDEGREQQNECNLPVFGEEPGDVVGGRNVLGVSLVDVGHALLSGSVLKREIKSHRGRKALLLWGPGPRAVARLHNEIGSAPPGTVGTVHDQKDP